MPRISDEQLLSICVQSVEQSAAWYDSELSEERSDAMDRYLGEPLGNEKEGASQVRTREVFDTIQWILPSLMRLFADADNLIAFEPRGPEDEEAAQQETETVSHVFWQQNRGFYNLLSFVTDGLLSKTGILKVWWDDSRDEERESYEGLTDEDFAELLNDPEWEREILELETNPDGTYSVVMKAVRDKGRARIEPCPPEEFGVERGARSCYAKDAAFCWHRVRKSKSELVEMGHDRDLVASLPDDDDLTSEEQLSRFAGEGDGSAEAADVSMQPVWVTECYIRVDRNDDGIAEQLRVTYAAGSSGSSGGVLLDVEEVDRVPFSTFSPIILTHKFYGLSIADIVTDLQEIKTALMRSILDSSYLANNGRTGVDEAVNLDDLLTSRPGGIVRTAGKDGPGNHIFPIPQQPIPPQSFELLDRLDGMAKARTGAGEDTPGLDVKSLANVNPSVAAIAYDAARQKIELLARIIAEIGLMPLFRDIQELMSKHATKPLTIRLRNGWTQVNPQEWKHREDMTPQVGLGLASRERRLTALEQVLDRQMAIGAQGGMGQLVTPAQIHKSHMQWTEALGLEPSLYWTDPTTVEPEQPAPDPQAQLIQAQMQIEGAKNQTAQQKIQADMTRAQTEAQLKAAEVKIRHEEAQAKVQVERLKGQLQVARAVSDSDTASMGREAEAYKAAKAAELKAAEIALKDAQERARLTMDWHKAALASSTTLTVEQMRHMGMDDVADTREANEEGARQEKTEMGDVIGNMTAMLQELLEAQNAPRVIERDASGRAISIGGRAIKRGANDLIESI